MYSLLSSTRTSIVWLTPEIIVVLSSTQAPPSLNPMLSHTIIPVRLLFKYTPGMLCSSLSPTPRTANFDASVGSGVGTVVGSKEGSKEGSREGNSVGIKDGCSVGVAVGKSVGVNVGISDGRNVGSAVGSIVGKLEGIGDGSRDGKGLGTRVGRGDGTMVPVSQETPYHEFVQGNPVIQFVFVFHETRPPVVS